MPAPLNAPARPADANAQDIFGCIITPAPWLPSEPAIQLALAALPSIADDTARGVIAELAMTVVDLREELQAVRAVCSVALAGHHRLHLENVALRARVAALVTERRQA